MFISEARTVATARRLSQLPCRRCSACRSGCRLSETCTPNGGRSPGFRRRISTSSRTSWPLAGLVVGPSPLHLALALRGRPGVGRRRRADREVREAPCTGGGQVRGGLRLGAVRPEGPRRLRAVSRESRCRCRHSVEIKSLGFMTCHASGVVDSDSIRRLACGPFGASRAGRPGGGQCVYEGGSVRFR